MSKLNKTIIIVTLILVAALIGLNFAGFSVSVSPFSHDVVFDTPAMAVMNGDRMYVLDKYSMRILCIDGKNLRWKMNGASTAEDGFYKAQSIAIDSHNRLIIHGVTYDETGSFVVNEYVKRFDTDGKYIDTIYSDSYSLDEAPTNSGYISNVTCRGDVIYISDKKENGLLLTTFSETDKSSVSSLLPCENIRFRALDTAVLSGTESGEAIYFTDKSGGICRLDANGDKYIYRPKDFSEGALGTIAYNLDVSDSGKIVFTDIGKRRILSLDGSDISVVVDNGGDASDEINNSPIRYPIQITTDCRIVTTDAESIEVFTSDGEELISTGSVRETLLNIVIQFAGWIIVAALIAAVIYFLVGFISKALKGNSADTVKISILGVVLVLTASTIVASMAISNANDNTNSEFQKNVQYIARLVSNQITGDAIEEINTPEDIYSDAYNNLKSEFNEYIKTSNETDYGLYYLVYKMIDGVPCIIIDSDSMYPAVYPSYVSDLFDSVYYGGNDEIILGYEDAYGVWACAASPLYNSDGKIVGLLEIGLNMYAINETRSSQNFELVLSIIVMIVMLLFVLSEGIGFYGFYEERRQQTKLSLDNNAPFVYTPKTYTILRTIMFFAFAAQSMQDSFISILAINIYKPVFGLPASVGGALPITLEMLMIALFSLIGGNLIAKYPIKNVMLTSFLIAMSGYAVCMFSPDFYVLMIGKIIVGTGIGLIYVSINTAATCVADTPGSEGIFADVNAGMMAGTELGIVVGSSLYSMSSYHMAYSASFGLCLIALVTTLLFVGKNQFMVTVSEKPESGGLSVLSFIFRRKSIAFLLCAIIPTLVGVAYFEYYFPIFGDSNGLTETRIGQIMLIYGLVAIYIGPAVTRFLLKTFGDKVSCMIVSFAFAAGLLLFTVAPSIWTMILIAVVFGLITGFSYSVQSSYFSKIEYIADYGEGRATGIYAMFQSISQSLAPILIGYMSLTNIITGTLITAAAIGVTGILFLLLSYDRLRRVKN